jgi:ribosomal protein L12E/L44/L45/RPP1/RPP2
VQEHADEIRGYCQAGLILLQDGSGKTLKLDELLGKAPAKPATPNPAIPAPAADAPSTEEEEAAEAAEEDVEEEPPYSDWDYADLVAEVKHRELEPESKRKDDLVAALEEDDGEE